jgi:hypothetical protein
LRHGIGRSVVAFALLLGIMTGFFGAGAARAAQNNPGSPGSAATVRFVQASPGAPDVDVIVQGKRIVEGLAFGKASDYVSIASGKQQVQIVPAGQNGDAALIDKEMDFDGGKAYIIATVGQLSDIDSETYEVNLDATDAGKARARTINLSPDAGKVTIAVAGGDNLFENVDFKDASDYKDIDAGTYDLEIHQDDNTLANSPGLAFDAGTVYDLAVIGQKSDQSLTLLPLATSVSPACSSLLGVGTQQDACLRIVHASPDAPAVDIYVNDTKVVSGLAFGKATEFTAVPAGNDRKIAITAAGGSVTDAVVTKGTGFDAGQAYQVVIAGSLDNGLDALINQVDLSPLPEQQARLRFIQASPDAGSVDLTVINGEKLFEGVDFKGESDYKVVDANTYDLAVMKDDKVVVRSDNLKIDAGNAYDLILVGRTDDNSLKLLLLSANVTLRTGGLATPVSGTPSPSVPLATPEVVGTPAT